jgi:hypothetical protein
MKKQITLISVLMICLVALLLSGKEPLTAQEENGSIIPPVAENAQYSIDLADIYAEVFPEKQQIYVICKLWLTTTFDPVVLRLGGNINHLLVSSSSQPNLNFYREGSSIYLFDLEPSAHQITLTYLVTHDGITSPGLISPESIRLAVDSWWYPRNVAPDPHQVILNIESPPDFEITSNANLLKDVANNFKQLRQFVLSQASADGLTLD